MERIKLLIVDDEIIVQQSCADIFTEKSDRYLISTVSSADMALKALENDCFDIILTDLKMPGQSGLKLISDISNKFPDTSIIVITGYATVKTAVEAMKLGAVDFIPKPFTPDEIFNAVENVVAKLKDKN